MALSHTKKYGVYHWDTFDNETCLLWETDLFADANDYVQKHYKGRIRADGADRVEIVNDCGSIVAHFWVG